MPKRFGKKTFRYGRKRLKYGKHGYNPKIAKVLTKKNKVTSKQALAVVSLNKRVFPKSLFLCLESEVCGYLPLGALNTGFGSTGPVGATFLYNGGAGRVGVNVIQVHFNQIITPWNTGRAWDMALPTAPNPGINAIAVAGTTAAATMNPQYVGKLLSANNNGCYQSYVVHASDISVSLQPGTQSDNMYCVIAPQNVGQNVIFYAPADIENRPFSKAKVMSSQSFQTNNTLHSRVKMRELCGMTKEQFRNACKEQKDGSQNGGMYYGTYGVPPVALYDWFIALQTIDNVALTGNPNLRIKVKYFTEFFDPSMETPLI